MRPNFGTREVVLAAYHQMGEAGRGSRQCHCSNDSDDDDGDGDEYDDDDDDLCELLLWVGIAGRLRPVGGEEPRTGWI